MEIDLPTILEWSALIAAVLWVIGLGCISIGSRRARRAFRGKGYLRPPSGKAWFRFLYFKHYDSFEDPGVRFFYRVARGTLFLFFFLALMLFIFLGTVFLLGRVNSGSPVPPPSATD